MPTDQERLEIARRARIEYEQSQQKTEESRSAQERKQQVLEAEIAAGRKAYCPRCMKLVDLVQGVITYHSVDVYAQDLEFRPCKAIGYTLAELSGYFNTKRSGP